jgi:sec-independent protein translocase protein TatA
LALPRLYGKGASGSGKEPVMFGLGYQELLLILVIVLILFGANRLPSLARSLGSSVKEFKKGVTELKDDVSPAQKKDNDKKA